MEVVVNDGVNYLLTTEAKFDIISTDGKTLPEYGVNGVFFSREYYTLMRDHLMPGGVVVQWIHTHYPPNIFRTVLHTFSRVFPNALLWYADGNCFLTGSNHEIDFDMAAIERKLGKPEGPFAGLRKFGITTAQSLLSHLIAAEDVLRDATADAPENSLERPVVEFYDFQDYAAPETDRKLSNLEFFLSLRGQGSAGDRIRALSGNMAAAFAAEGEYLQGRKMLLSGGSAADTREHFERALKLDPDNEDVRYHIYGHVMQTVRNLMDADRNTEAEPYLRQAVELQPGSSEARYRYGILLMALNQPTQAVREFEALVALEPSNTTARHELATFYAANNELDRAIHQLRSILKIDPGDAGALFKLAHHEAARRSFETALELLERAYSIAPRQPEVIDSYAWLSYLLQDLDTARRVVEQGGLYYEGNADFEQRRRTILAAEKAAAP